MSKTMTSKRHQVVFLPNKAVIDVNKNVKATNDMKDMNTTSLF